MKKSFLTIICLAILLPAVGFAGGQQGEAEGTKEFTAFIGESRPAMPAEGTLIGDQIEAITGVKVEMEYLVGDLMTKAGVMLASGDMPDFINARNEHYRFRSDGYLIPLEDLINEHAPNLKKLLDPKWDSYFQEGPDGEMHLFAVPDLISYGPEALTRPDNAWWIQAAVLEDAGWPEVETFEQYWKLIEDYKAKYPTIENEETIGFELLTFDWYKWYVYEAAHEAMEGAINSSYRVANVDGKWVADELVYSPETKNYFKEMNKMFRKGLINPEGFVNDIDQYKAALASGRVLGTYQPYWVIQDSLNYLVANNEDRQMVGFPLRWEKGDDVSYTDIPSTAKGMGTSISVDCKDPVGAIKYLDALVTDEIQMLGYWGIEGVDYYRDDNGRVNRTDEQNANFADRSNDYYYPVWGGEYYIEFWPAINGTFDDGTATRYGSQPEIFFQALTEKEKEILTNLGWDTFASEFTAKNDPKIADRSVYSPLWDITPDTGTIEQQYITSLTQAGVRDGAIPQLIMAGSENEFEAVWNKFVEDVKTLPGHNETRAFYQANIDERAGQ